MSEPLAVAIVSVLATALVSWWLFHVNAAAKAKRETENTKVHFLAFMQAWRARINQRHFEICGTGRDPSAFTDGISEFRAVVEFLKQGAGAEYRSIVDKHVSGICECRPNKPDQITQAVDNMIAYVEKS